MKRNNFFDSSTGYILRSSKVFQVYFEKDSAYPVLIQCYAEYTANKDTVAPVRASYLGYLKYKDLKGHSNLVVSLKKSIRNKEPYVSSYIPRCTAIPTDNPKEPYFLRSCDTKHIQLLYVYDNTPLITETERIARRNKKRHYKNGPLTLWKLLKEKELNPELKDIHYSIIPVSIKSFSYNAIVDAGIHMQNDHPDLFENLTHTFDHPDFKSNLQDTNPYFSEAYVYENGIRTNSEYIDFASAYYYRNFWDVKDHIDSELMRYFTFKKNNPNASPSEGADIIVNALVNEGLALLINNIATGLWKPEALCGAGILVCMKELLMRSGALKDIPFEPLKMKSVLIRLHKVLKGIDDKLQNGNLISVLRNYWKQYTHRDVTVYPKTYTYSELKRIKKTVKPEELKNNEEYKKLKETNREFMLEYKRQHGMKSKHSVGFKIKQESKSAIIVKAIVEENKSYNVVSKELKVGKATIVKAMKEYHEKQKTLAETPKTSVDLLSYETYAYDEMPWAEQNALMRSGIMPCNLEKKINSIKRFNNIEYAEYHRSKTLCLKHYMSRQEELNIYESCKGAIDFALSTLEQHLNKPFILLNL